MGSGSFEDTIQAASTRARDCRIRIEQLRGGSAYSAEHVRHAREQLDNARRRTALALQRAMARNLNPPLHISAADDGPTDVDSPTRPAVVGVPIMDRASFGDRLSRLDCSIADFWVGYAALGGRCSVFEIDAAVNGALILTDIDTMRLDQALWERENFR